MEDPTPDVGLGADLVIALDQLLVDEYEPTAPDQTAKVLDTGRCYICGTGNFEGDHLNEHGWPRACPTGLTRAEADAIRRARGEQIP